MERNHNILVSRQMGSPDKCLQQYLHAQYFQTVQARSSLMLDLHHGVQHLWRRDETKDVDLCPLQYQHRFLFGIKHINPEQLHRAYLNNIVLPFLACRRTQIQHIPLTTHYYISQYSPLNSFKGQ